MNYLLVENLSKAFGERVLFENLSFSIEKGQKVALIARNGEGKSTLMRILMGRETADSGNIRLNKDVRMAYLPQEPELDETKSILDNILSGGNALIEAIRQYESAAEEMAERDDAASRSKFEQAVNLVDHLKAWDYETKIRQILTRLDIHHLAQPVNTLSGGQRKRVALARVLVEEPELVLMDEPTNHLDIEMIEWLEEYLSRSALALLLVTHDRYFLERVTNEILELENQTLYRYKGSYSAYLEAKEARQASQAKEVDRARNLMRKELEWMRRQPKARGTKSKSRIDAFYDLEEKAAGQKAETGVQLQVQMSRLGGKIIELEHVSKRFGEKVILDNFSYIFQRKERVGLVGPNGVGKSSFLNILTGALPPDKGKIDTGETIVFGYYTQAGMKLPEDKRVIEVVTEIAEHIPVGQNETLSASQFLQRFGFEPARQYTMVSKLSGGEKRRLYLLTILIKNPNFLILDEPTNDLDLVTLNTLEEFLMDFPGCLIIVSHDRYFLDKLADHLFIFEGEGKIKDFNGKYSDYRELVNELEREKKTAAAPKAPEKPAPVKTEEKRKLSYKEKKELESLEAEISELESRKEALEAKLSTGEGKAEDFSEWSKDLHNLNSDLETKTNRWLELSEMGE